MSFQLLRDFGMPLDQIHLLGAIGLHVVQFPWPAPLLHELPFAVADAAVVRIDRIDLDEAFLLQFREPAVAARLLAAALVFDEPATR